MADVDEHRESGKTVSKKNSACRTKRKRLSSSDYVLKKRQPFGSGRKGNRDVFVTNKTNFKAQLKKCEQLFDDGASEIIIHGLGAAINRACNLALQLKETHHGGVDLEVKTSTTSIINDFEPLNDEADYETINRNNSSVHIRVFRNFSVSGLKYQE